MYPHARGSAFTRGVQKGHCVPGPYQDAAPPLITECGRTRAVRLAIRVVINAHPVRLRVLRPPARADRDGAVGMRRSENDGVLRVVAGCDVPAFNHIARERKRTGRTGQRKQENKHRLRNGRVVFAARGLAIAFSIIHEGEYRRFRVGSPAGSAARLQLGVIARTCQFKISSQHSNRSIFKSPAHVPDEAKAAADMRMTRMSKEYARSHKNGKKWTAGGLTPPSLARWQTCWAPPCVRAGRWSTCDAHR